MTINAGLKFIPYVLVLLQHNNSIVLLRRAENCDFGSGEYCMVGGKIEQGETARQAAVREVAEEVGVAIQPENLEFVHLFHRKGPNEDLFAVIFKAIDWIGEVSNKEPHKHDQMGWFDLDRLPENLLPAHRQALDCISSGSHYSEHGW